MEAMWTRYLPQTDIARQLLADGVLGEVRVVTADFGGRATFDATGRLWDPALAGGALLDLGVYVVSGPPSPSARPPASSRRAPSPPPESTSRPPWC